MVLNDCRKFRWNRMKFLKKQKNPKWQFFEHFLATFLRSKTDARPHKGD